MKALGSLNVPAALVAGTGGHKAGQAGGHVDRAKKAEEAFAARRAAALAKQSNK
jgi:hypothetical protein